MVFAITHTEPGGLREIWQDVAAGLEERGLRTGLVSLYPRAGERVEAGAAGWGFILNRPRRTPWSAIALVWRVVHWLRQTRPRIVITGMPFCNVLFSICCTMAGTGTKVILSHHTPSFTYQNVLNILDRRTGCSPAVAAIISVSDAVGRSFAAWPVAYRAKQRTIHNSLPARIEQLVDGMAMVPRDRSDGALRIMAVGRLSSQKNHAQLIRAMAFAPDGVLEIIGAGEDEADLRALIAQLDLAHKVTLLGQFPREDTLRRLAGADVFVQVSLFEGHSLALLEAARMGVPLIVSQVAEQIEGITDEQGELCGVAVPLGDATALGHILQEWAMDEAQRRSWAQKSLRLGHMRSSCNLIEHYEALLAELGVQREEGNCALHSRQEELV
ncbi:glycosyltransferase [Novosphingobium sp. SG707]|uniref:glycosyltransferase n=1 Tax=Novosphingobium sp. SG707 TaxID=2586996 RepID=UPI0015520873